MGRKATVYLIHVLLGVFTLAVAGLTVAGWAASRVSPCENGFVALMGLGLQLLLALDLLLFIYWLARLRWWALLPAAVIALNFGFIASSFRMVPGASGRVTDLTVASYNIHAFKAGKYKISVENIAMIMKKEGVDVLCMQEFDLNRKYGLDSLRKAFSYLPYVFIPERNGTNSDIAVFSRFPILSTGYIRFHGSENDAMWVDLDAKGRRIRVFNNHLQTTSISQSRAEIARMGQFDPGYLDDNARATKIVLGRLVRNFCKRAAQAETVRAVVDTTSCPVVVCGDFNDTPASYVYARMKQGLTDGFIEHGGGYGYTFRGFGRLLRIDYILYGQGIEGVAYRSPSLEWSDHNPVIMEFSLPQ